MVSEDSTSGFPSKSLHKNLHTTAKTEDKVQRRFLLNIVVGQSATILKLLSGEDEALLVRGCCDGSDSSHVPT